MAGLSHRLGHPFRQWLTHPLARRLSPDDEIAPAVHRLIIREKALLRDVYDEWYRALAAEVGQARPVLELGGGAGYLQEFIPGLISSDVRATPAADLLLDAHAMPFGDAALGAIVMTNVVHHLPEAGAFFQEAARVVRPGGVIAVIEPWVTPWSSWVYRTLHHEPFEPGASEWEFASTGPLSGANGALPWMMFERDRSRFEREHPGWQVESVRPGWPLRYLLSGGVSIRNLVPSWGHGLWRGVDRTLERWPNHWAMFALVVLRRREEQDSCANAAVDGADPCLD